MTKKQFGFHVNYDTTRKMIFYNCPMQLCFSSLCHMQLKILSMHP